MCVRFASGFGGELIRFILFNFFRGALLFYPQQSKPPLRVRTTISEVSKVGQRFGFEK